MAKKILLIDDDHGALDLLELFLYKEYEIITALNGFEGLTRAEKEVPDLITTDITMPTMDGIQFFNRAAKSALVKHVPIVAITSFAENATGKSLLNMGFRGVIPKPIERDIVRKTVADALGGSKETKGQTDRP
ncbi:MAG: response regulator [Chitinispirillia bacterium]|nr:response regulator [Chitinispirillia bacterium]MCL2242532.1 response regulator [Chitinispirillia bacterium]